ncbi:hypothetical protein GCM10029963_44260 [Micromonospora andamanensis]
MLRHGDPVAETIRLAGEVGAEGVALSADVSRYAARRAQRLRAECDRHRLHLRFFPGLTVVEPGELTPGGGDHYRVFSPYHRAWSARRWREELSTPTTVVLPAGVPVGRLPALPAGDSPDLVTGGEDEARQRLARWLPDVVRYGDRHDDMAGDATSRLSPYLRFGCLSPLTVANTIDDRESPFVRQLCWRDFYHQVTAAFPELPRKAYRRRATEHWRYDEQALTAWAEGRTGLPIVDAGMRQLRAQGWLHNRARLITAGYLTKTLGLDWRDGQAVYFRWLLDGDIADNSGNWQWVAGTGNDTRPYRGSTRCGRPSGTTPTERTCGAGCPNWHRWRVARCTSRGGCRRRCAARSTIRHRWNRRATPRSGCAELIRVPGWPGADRCAMLAAWRSRKLWTWWCSGSASAVRRWPVGSRRPGSPWSVSNATWSAGSARTGAVSRAR